ncbi:ribonuclease P protein component [Candidatus Saccharibacteria bacterium]|nr:ribonuclease P protein component [Candidatus Saccharibacteria bacterium]
MLPSKYRFHSRGGVQATLRAGKTERGEKVSVVWAKNSRGGTRFGVTIGKKTLKSAVGRNRVRRRTYEIIRGWLGAQAERPQLDVIVILYSAEFREMPYGEFRERLVGLLSKTTKATHSGTKSV